MERCETSAISRKIVTEQTSRTIKIDARISTSRNTDESLFQQSYISRRTQNFVLVIVITNFRYNKEN